MSSLRIGFLACSFLLSGVVHGGEASLPELKTLLTSEEWKRAGLDRLSPDEIGVIDAALIRYSVAHRLPAPAPAEAPAAAPAPAALPAAQPKTSLLDRFGLPSFDTDWRALPPLGAKVVGWDGPNHFVLDNGQVWQSDEAIPYDLVGKAVEIHARPNHRFVLVLDGRSTGLRVSRIR